MVESVHHPAFPQLSNPDTAIWRYLTQQKFEWMVCKDRIYMPNVVQLGDLLEGTQPEGDKAWWQSLAHNAKSEDERQVVKHNHELISRFAAVFRTRYYVSCWHINEAVNPEMWRSYANNPKSVAIRTTVAKLRVALPNYVSIGIVRYIDYAIDRLPTNNMLEYVTHKHKSFEHERELRIVSMHPMVAGFDQQHFQTNYFENSNNPNIRFFAPYVELVGLLESILIHPQAPKHFVEKVIALCKERGLPIPQQAVW